MDALKSYLADLSHPIFVIEAKSRKVIFANKTAYLNSRQNCYSSTNIDEIIHSIELPISGKLFTQFNHSWYSISQKDIQSEIGSFIILELKPRKDLPGNEEIEKWKNMIALILHRFRSPLNGITGYLELLENDIENERGVFEKRLTTIQNGFDHIYNMMDELEVLYNISTELTKEDLNLINVNNIVKEVLLWFNEVQRERIIFGESNTALEIDSNPKSLKEILKTLLSNSLEHSNDYNIKVDLSTANGAKITIKNDGGPIPEEIREQIFHPFVTTKATNFGIGLTKALLYANQIDGTIFMEQEGNQVYFTLYFPLSKG